MSNTPRTDAVTDATILSEDSQEAWINDYNLLTLHAQKLERELAGRDKDAIAWRAEWHKQANEIYTLKNDLKLARKAIEYHQNKDAVHPRSEMPTSFPDYTGHSRTQLEQIATQRDSMREAEKAKAAIFFAVRDERDALREQIAELMAALEIAIEEAPGWKIDVIATLAKVKE